MGLNGMGPNETNSNGMESNETKTDQEGFLEGKQAANIEIGVDIRGSQDGLAQCRSGSRLILR